MENTSKLTVKQDKFCWEYVKLGSKSAAYRAAYSTKNMTSKTVNEKASRLSSNGKIRARVEHLQKELEERNKMTLDKVVSAISEIALFDIAELYDEQGNFKSIHEIPKSIRTAINSIKITEEFQGFGKDKESIGFIKEVKIINKLDVYIELMRYFGGYKQDNEQKAAVFNSAEAREKRVEELVAKAKRNN
ncbi:MAG: terminase small subunit [Lutibacter sp.]